MRIKDINPEFCQDNEFLPVMLSVLDHVLETLRVAKIENGNVEMESGIRGAFNIYQRPIIYFIKGLTSFKVNPYKIRSFGDMAKAFLEVVAPERNHKLAWDLVDAMDDNMAKVLNCVAPAESVYVNKELSLDVPSDASLIAAWRLERGL